MHVEGRKVFSEINLIIGQVEPAKILGDNGGVFDCRLVD